MVIADFEIPSTSLRNSISAVFALLSTAGAATLIFKASPYNPTISFRRAFGCTRTVSANRREAAS